MQIWSVLFYDDSRGDAVLRSLMGLWSNLPQQLFFRHENRVLRARIVPSVDMPDKVEVRWVTVTFELMRI